MKSLILATATRFLLPLLLLFSVHLLLRGHNEPGGGFVGGLVAAAAFCLYTIAFGVGEARKLLRVQPESLMAVGLGVACLSGAVSTLRGLPFMTGLWLEAKVAVVGKVGTPFLFDLGVYLVVIGITLTIIFSLAEE